eukprot:10831-Heterococcus_DN1.PRE.2
MSFRCRCTSQQQQQLMLLAVSLLYKCAQHSVPLSVHCASAVAQPLLRPAAAVSAEGPGRQLHRCCSCAEHKTKRYNSSTTAVSLMSYSSLCTCNHRQSPTLAADHRSALKRLLAHEDSTNKQ